MNLSFDIDNVTETEFGVGHGDVEHSEFVLIPVVEGVQTALQEMVKTTWDTMRQNAEEPSQYEPSQKYAGTEHLYMATSNQMGALFFNLHKAENLPIEANALNDPEKISSYFVRLTDHQECRLTGLRRASQFKGLLKKKNRLMRVIDDTLQIVEEKVFRLDNDFDLLIDSENLHILRPVAFESLGDLKQSILDSVPLNVASVNQDLSYVDFDSVQAYASEHLLAARYLSSIRTQNLKSMDRTALKTLCKKTKVEIAETNGRITVSKEHVKGFLEVLDRRRYVDELDPQAPEPYRAASRQKILPP